MIARLRHTFAAYPPQFWLIVFGVMFSSIGSSIIWPFQLIYISHTLDRPLTATATLITISSAIGLTVSFLGGSLADRFGRKPIMVLALTGHSLAYILMSRANSYPAFLLPMSIMGAAMPFYAVGSDAMMADLLTPPKRPGGYSILRMMNNAGIAIGPVIGGLLVTRSYALAFYAAAAGMLTYALLLLVFARETLHRAPQGETTESFAQNLLGFGQVFRDRTFIVFVAATAFGLIAPLMMWTLLAVYTNTYFGLPEDLYAWLPVTNALMCVFVQYFVTLVTRRFRPILMIAAGMLVYAVGVGSVGVMSGFWGFWTSMVIMTLGELILMPTGTTYAANRAPEAMRGRYMSIYWLTWGLARAAAPMIGGFLHDQIAPVAIWYGGLAFGLLSALVLFALATRQDDLAPSKGRSAPSV
ncbi:MAG: MFS transporter [Anaerolineales bacterium]